LTSDIVIEEVHELPRDLSLELMGAARGEGFAPVGWLRDQWLDGTNKFSGPGEALFVVREQERLIAICGLNRDPYDMSGSSGRLRRLYVLPELRLRGVGRMLVEVVLEASRDHFEAVNLRTLDDNSAAFFESLGFGRVEGIEGATHRKLNA
jgi:GNAT superfamily N-acetyltransferase